MKTKSLRAFLFLLPWVMRADSSSDGVLLKADAIRVEGNQRTVATGRASITVGDFRATAEEISIDAPTGQMTLSGDITLHSGRTVLKAKELTLETKGMRMFTLAKGSVSPAGPGWEQIKDDKGTTIHFLTPYPKTETQLKAAPR